MKKINNIILFVGIVMLALSCDNTDTPTAEDNFLNYEVESVPVTEDYIVGANYNRFTWDPDITEQPVLGQYDASNGDPVAYQEHIEMAKQGGIDFFIFGMRSGVNPANYSSDSLYVETLQTAPNAGEVNFALNYNFQAMGLNNNTSIESAGLVQQFIDDFTAMSYFFQQSNYMKTDDGKAIVYISQANDLTSDDSVTLYNNMRAAVNSLGIELYIIGIQPAWTPPLRWDFRFENAVDAVSHATYMVVTRAFYDRFELFEQYTDQALTFAKEEFERVGLEYVPQVSPSYDPRIWNPNSGNYVFPKDEETFRTFCDVAKKATSSKRIITVDAFNNWNFDTQLEPAQSYGTQYLEILRDEFKVN
ncbi:glycoside hydrolase family 99-like domain-containing protein [Galbibacter sp. BG1]|uniref:glycoside hydrolase family 99-like domain-containing protein n=1 Tax=Galbibacter sp. BG1 TaxID=1170699 RepID=UPI0015BCBBD5|nr:glycoside hydrolase family 99-like domain-containing protein [Galbibacter sp. BG1]QLE02442.1 glycoside hydrolase family 99-like domain-containing protein [Galbibacter sp. BG1]